MVKSRTKEDVFERCDSEGVFIPRESVDVEKIKSTVRIAIEDLENGNDAKKKKRYNCAYKMYYDALREIIEAFLSFDKIKSTNHIGLFAYLCVKYPCFELDWDFFEKIRTKRNGINYYSIPVTFNDFKQIELQTQLYFNLFKKEIEDRVE